MKTIDDIERLEKVIGQLEGAYSEVSILAKKAPNDSLNNFKLRLVNKVISAANEVLGERYRPFDDFLLFDIDDVPTSSDVSMVLAHYMQEAERYRSDNVVYDLGWKYVVDGETTDIPSGPPSKVGKK